MKKRDSSAGKSHDMLLGVLSDSHGDADATRLALDLLAARGATTFIHCGDVCGERVLDQLAGHNAHFVWGNCDDPSPLLRTYVKQLGLPWPSGPLHLELAGQRIGVFHGHEREFRAALQSPDLDLIFFGHTHRFEDNNKGGVRAINPGALFRANPRTCALMNLTTGHVTFLTLDGRELA